MYIRKVLALLIISFGLTGCATGPKFTAVSAVEPSKALVYIYRDSNFTNSGITPPVMIDGKQHEGVTNGGYNWLVRDPGIISLGLNFGDYREDNDTKVNLESGKTYYFGINTGRKHIESSAVHSTFYRSFRIDQVDENIAKDVITSQRLDIDSLK